jgi:guanylate kinase
MIVILCGKSGSGKDTVLKRLIDDKKNNFSAVVSTTTRPMRVGEKDGRDYNFVTKEEFLKKIDEGKFLEYRTYNTLVNGNPDTWHYGSPVIDTNDGKNYAVVLDMQGVKDYINHYGRKNCTVIMLTVPDDVRESRAKLRGSFDQTEWDRRAKDDAVKFSQEATAGLVDAIINNNDTPDSVYKKIKHIISV